MKSAGYFIVFIALMTVIVSCRSKSDSKKTKAVPVNFTDNASVDIIAQDFRFQVPDTLPSGWVTIRFHNNGKQTHFFMFNKLPDGRTYQDYLNEVAPPFGNVWTALRDSGINKQEATTRLINSLPQWSADIQTIGGSGLIAPGETSNIALKLVPGNYEMECYVKSPEGVFHGALGMISHVIVSEDSTNLKPPDADIHLTLINHTIDYEGNISAGKHIVAVHFKDKTPFGMGDDVHLVRLDETTDIDKVVEWMNWMNLHGLEAPAPAVFLGGVQEMPRGSTEYFAINLKPGRYAWISESYASAGMLKQFTAE